MNERSRPATEFRAAPLSQFTAEQDYTESSGSLTFADQLDALGYRDDEFVSVCRQKPGGPFLSAVKPPELAPDYAEALGDGFDIWHSVNPTAGPAREGAGRGTADQITRLAGLGLDLDFKAGACADLAVAEKIINEVSAQVGQRPVDVVETGHGLQPRWAIEDGDITDTFSTADASALSARFGRLAGAVADSYGADIDTVSDTARVLRVVGTMNVGKGDPVRVTGRVDVGGPLGVAELSERLDDAGIGYQPDDATEAEQLSDPAGWTFGEQTHAWVAAMINGWPTDTPTKRNPWACSKAVKLFCAWRLACITEADFRRALALLEARLATLVTTTEPRRALRKFEMRDIRRLGRKRASEKTDEQVAAELGDHHRDDWTDTIGAASTDGQTAPGSTDEDGEQKPPTLADRLLTRSALRNLPAPEPMIDEVLDRGTCALLYGHRGSLKSFIALDWEPAPPPAATGRADAPSRCGASTSPPRAPTATPGASRHGRGGGDRRSTTGRWTGCPDR